MLGLLLLLLVAPAGGSIEGQVRDARDGSALADGEAVVWCDCLADSPREVDLDAQGAFAFEDLPPGAYQLYVYAGNSSAMMMVELSQDEAARREFSIVPRPAELFRAGPQGCGWSCGRAPRNLDQAVSRLHAWLTPEGAAYLAESTDSLHMSLGAAIRNEFGLWRRRRLSRWMWRRGVCHPDHMSGVIIAALRQRVRGEPVTEPSGPRCRRRGR